MSARTGMETNKITIKANIGNRMDKHKGKLSGFATPIGIPANPRSVAIGGVEQRGSEMVAL